MIKVLKDSNGNVIPTEGLSNDQIEVLKKIYKIENSTNEIDTNAVGKQLVSLLSYISSTAVEVKPEIRKEFFTKATQIALAIYSKFGLDNLTQITNIINEYDVKEQRGVYSSSIYMGASEDSELEFMIRATGELVPVISLIPGLEQRFDNDPDMAKVQRVGKAFSEGGISEAKKEYDETYTDEALKEMLNSDEVPEEVKQLIKVLTEVSDCSVKVVKVTK